MASPPPSLETTCSDHKVETLDRALAKRLDQAQWLRAVILGSSDGLLSTATLMLGIGATKEDQQSMIISGIAGALAGACSMVVGEFASVSTQRDIELAAISNRNADDASVYSPPGKKSLHGYCAAKSPVMQTIVQDERANQESGTVNSLPNAYKAGMASGLAFLCGSLVPLLADIGIANRAARIIVIVGVTSSGLALSGGTGAWFGGSKPLSPAMRVLLGGWISMAITYGLLKYFDNDLDNHDGGKMK